MFTTNLRHRAAELLIGTLLFHGTAAAQAPATVEVVPVPCIGGVRAHHPLPRRRPRGGQGFRCGGTVEAPKLVSRFRYNYAELYPADFIAGTHAVFRAGTYVFITDEVLPGT